MKEGGFFFRLPRGQQQPPLVLAAHFQILGFALQVEPRFKNKPANLMDQLTSLQRPSKPRRLSIFRSSQRLKGECGFGAATRFSKPRSAADEMKVQQMFLLRGSHPQSFYARMLTIESSGAGAAKLDPANPGPINAGFYAGQNKLYIRHFQCSRT